MITRINKIKNFGVFKNFNGTILPEFKTFNLIYGWNYSGKTTLSRVFRSLENGKLHDDYLTATFELQGDANTYDNNFTVKPNIRVFNSDFIKENLKWDAENIEPIFLLGSENIELQKELADKESTLQKSEEELAKAKGLHHEKGQRINSAMTNKAREVGSLLSIRPFDIRHFNPIVEKTKTAPTILTQKDFDIYKTQALSSEQKPEIGEISVTITGLSVLKTEVEDILNRQAISEGKIKQLVDNKTLSDWVETGRGLHEKKTECQFCGNSLPLDLLERLNKHFSKDFDLLKSDIQRKIQRLSASKIVLNKALPTETAFYPDIRVDFAKHKPVLETAINGYNQAIDSLLKDLDAKTEKPFDKLNTTAITDNQKELEDALADFNTIIKTNDKRTIEFTKGKKLATEKLKEHFAADFAIKEKYSQIQAELANEKEAIAIKDKDIENQKQIIIQIKAKLNETVKGAGRVNDFLKIFFGKDDIQIEATPDKKFRLMRGTEVAKNLSEGEKTAISFAYFTAKLEEQNNKLSDTIIYIDDPVSSLDSNHLFNIYSFIKNTFYEFPIDQATGKRTHVFKCNQLFISTHNFDFHNLVFDWYKKIGKNKQNYFVVERHKNSYKDESSIKENTKLLTVFNSEYAYLFSLIYNFHTNPNDTYEFLYHMPNISRRFIETYLNFKYLTPSKIDEDIDKLITEPVKCERARKFMHYYSHNLTTDKFMGFADLSECTDVIDIILEAIKNDDPVHFQSLTDSLN